MSERKKFVAFLSFADPDRELAESLSKLFLLLNRHTYFAPIELSKAGSPEWRKQIINAIQRSHAFVPIYTRHSLRRPWVLYESGVADAAKLPRFPARVSTVSVSEIEDLPSPSALCYDLSDKRSLADLITNVCLSACGPADREVVAVEVERVMMTRIAKRIITMSKIRWVFIAGNRPNNLSQPDSGVSWHMTQADYDARLRAFVEVLTEKLLNSGFSVAACPQVPTLGMHVTSKALSCIDSGNCSEGANFRISGIYPIDREAREIKLTESARKKWLEHILSFRKTYLADQEWLFLIGGNEGTREEYEAARECNVKVLSIPCFGGTATRVYHNGKDHISSSCICCQKRDGSCGSEEISKIVEVAKKASA